MGFICLTKFRTGRIFNLDSINALFGLEKMFWGLKVTICLPHTSYYLKSSRCHEKATWSFMPLWTTGQTLMKITLNPELTQLRSHTFCAGFWQRRLGLFENANAQRAVEVSSGQETDPDTGENSLWGRSFWEALLEFHQPATAQWMCSTLKRTDDGRLMMVHFHLQEV